MPTLHSQTRCQTAQATATTKALSKSVSVQTHGRQDIAAKMKEKLTERINNETVTKAICNKGFSVNSSILLRSNFGVDVQVCSPQSLTTYSLNRWRSV